MIQDIESHIHDYYAWLHDKTMLKQLDKDWVEITTPYLNRHNDYIQIYAKPDKEGYLLTDGGETVLDLMQSGFSFENSPKRKKIFNTILNGFGVQEGENNEIKVYAGAENFSLRKHHLIQAMMAVDDMFFLAQPYVAALFREEVADWLDLCDIRYTPDVRLSGKTYFDHLFHFIVPKSKQAPERIIQAINHPDEHHAKLFIMSWMDTRDRRTDNAMAYAFLNDKEHAVSSDVLRGFRSYALEPVPWSRREEVREKLAV